VTQPPPVPLTGDQYVLSAGEYQATVTELGAGLRELSYAGRPALSGYQADEVPPAGSGELLIPWPNRVDGGRYSFGGGSYQLDLSEPKAGNAIHGLTRWVSWAGVDAQPAAAELAYTLHGQPGYPFCLELAARYELAADGLTVSVTARNAGSRPAPYGTGQHPYLTAGAPLVDECRLELPAAAWLPADDRGIPDGVPQDVTGTPFDFRQARPVGAARIDHAFTGLTRDADGRAWARLSGPAGTVALWAGPGYGWLQAFTGDTLGPDRARRALAIEPMTCPPNALVSGIDLLTLAPGDSITHTWGIQVTPV
jgi:aldose 1-epimerase